MNTPALAASLLALAATASLGLGAPAAFHGKVDFKITSSRGPVNLTYFVKGDRARTEFALEGGRSAAVIMNFGQHEMTMLMPEQKMYMVRPLTVPTASEGSRAAGGPPPEVKRTGQYETILGHKCEKIVVKSQNETTEIWGAEDMGVFMNPAMTGPMGRPAANPSSAWEAELFQRGFFPMRVVTRDADGKETNRMEVTAIDASPLADSLFAPPADYRKFEMPTIPGMGGMNPFKR